MQEIKLTNCSSSPSFLVNTVKRVTSAKAYTAQCQEVQRGVFNCSFN